jgi:hypothetical protein
MRHTGFYWVKYKGEWEVAQWFADHWLRLGTEEMITNDDVFELIDEKKIVWLGRSA